MFYSLFHFTLFYFFAVSLHFYSSFTSPLFYIVSVDLHIHFNLQTSFNLIFILFNLDLFYCYNLSFVLEYTVGKVKYKQKHLLVV